MTKSKAPKDKSTMIFMVVVLLLTLVGAGTGFAVGSLIQPEANANTGTSASDTARAVPAPKAGHSPKDSHDAQTGNHDISQTQAVGAPSVDEEVVEIIDPHSLKTVVFPPVLTTLAEPQGKWVRLEGAILITTEAEDSPEVLANRSGEQILTYLRSLRLSQLEGPSGIMGIREDLNEMLQVLSRGQVKGLLINGLVVE